MTSDRTHPHAPGRTGTAEDSILRPDDGAVHVRQEGPADAPVLLLVHGSATSSRSWDAVAPLLAADHRVVLVDLPGHGRSPAPPGRGCTTAEQAGAVAEALDRLGVGPVVAVGHSSGGYVVTALAERRPDLVSALVLVNTGPRMDAYISSAPVAFDPAHWPPSDEQIRMFASTAFRPGFEVPQELVDELRGMSLRAVAAAMEGSTAYLTERPLPDRLTALGKPLHVLFGDLDRRWDPASAAEYRIVPGTEVVALPGSGHTPVLEDPEGTAAGILAFTRARPGGAA